MHLKERMLTMAYDSLQRLLLDNLTTAVVLLNGELRLEYMNPAAEMLLGVSGQRSLGQFVSELFSEMPDGLAALRQAVASGHPFTKREAQLLCNSLQPPLTVDYTATPMTGLGGALLLLELHPRDRLLRITKEEAQLSKQETTRLLVRGLAHEIKNPLGGIRGAAQLLEMELDSRELKEYTQVIIHEADRLQSLVDRLLAPHRHPHQLADLNIHEVCERVRSLVLLEYPQGLKVRRDYDISIPEFKGERAQLIQALLNIVQNAAQVLSDKITSGEAEIVLRTRVARQVTIGRQRHRLALELHVIDNGPGVPDHIKERIFYPLVTGRDGGSGLGLPLAQTFVQRHHGLIECESMPGRTDFRILIPLP